MTIEDAIKMLKAKLECMTRDTSGSDDDCNHKRCDQCHLNYEKGTMGEQKECLKTVIKALEQEPCEDAISRQAVLSKIKEVCFSEEWLKFRADNGSDGQRDFLINYIEQLPPVTLQPKTDFEHKAEIVISQLRADRDRLADAIEKIRAEIDFQQMWLLRAGYTSYNVDIALDAIKAVVESEGEE